jgi:hypothetical protein
MLSEGHSKTPVVEMLRPVLFLLVGTAAAWTLADLIFNYLCLADSYWRRLLF